MTRIPTAGGHARAVPVARRASASTAVDRCGSASRGELETSRCGRPSNLWLGRDDNGACGSPYPRLCGI